MFPGLFLTSHFFRRQCLQCYGCSYPGPVLTDAVLSFPLHPKCSPVLALSITLCLSGCTGERERDKDRDRDREDRDKDRCVPFSTAFVPLQCFCSNPAFFAPNQCCPTSFAPVSTFMIQPSHITACHRPAAHKCTGQTPLWPGQMLKKAWDSYPKADG